jgi:ATP phosphoribosyltransferase
MAVFTFALPAGRLAIESTKFFHDSGLCSIEIPEGSRELAFTDQTGRFRVILVRPADVPTCILQGGAHAGITGKDVLLEGDYDLTTPVELGFGRCRLSVAALKQAGDVLSRKHVRAATKYPVQAMNYFFQKGHFVRNHQAARFRGNCACIEPGRLYCRSLYPRAQRYAPMVLLSWTRFSKAKLCWLWDGLRTVLSRKLCTRY